MERLLCQIEGCNCFAEKHKTIKGIAYYRKLCTKHKRQKYGMTPGGRKGYKRIKLNSKEKFKKKKLPCSICGWDKGNCDIHRKIPGKENGTYNFSNMISLCPNCHRLVHLGILKLT